jgi:hypothetical protein
MAHQDWMESFKGLVFMAALGIAILYFLEWNGSFSEAAFRQAQRAIGKRPRRWQLDGMHSLDFHSAGRNAAHLDS